MTTNLKFFCGLAMVFSFAFFYSLYAALSAQAYNSIWIYALLFGLGLLISGFYLGYNDPVRDSKLDLGFQYHLVTFIIVNSIGIPALFLYMGFNTETVLGASSSSVFWGLGLMVHYYFSSRSIKGLDKKNIFD